MIIDKGKAAQSCKQEKEVKAAITTLLLDSFPGKISQLKLQFTVSFLEIIFLPNHTVLIAPHPLQIPSFLVSLLHCFLK